MSARSHCAACGEDCTDTEHVPASGWIARGLKVASDATVCADCSTQLPRRDIGDVVYHAIRGRLRAVGLDTPMLSSAGDKLLMRRPLTREAKDLACAAWLAADGHYACAAEALSPDGDGAAWVEREAAAQGVEVRP